MCGKRQAAGSLPVPGSRARRNRLVIPLPDAAEERARAAGRATGEPEHGSVACHDARGILLRLALELLQQSLVRLLLLGDEVGINRQGRGCRGGLLH